MRIRSILVLIPVVALLLALGDRPYDPHGILTILFLLGSAMSPRLLGWPYYSKLGPMTRPFLRWFLGVIGTILGCIALGAIRAPNRIVVQLQIASPGVMLAVAVLAGTLVEYMVTVIEEARSFYGRGA